MDRIKSLFITLSLFLMPALAFAQNEGAVVNTLKKDGKIYVVVLVLITIFVGIIVYLFSLERKIRRLEKDNK